MMLVFFKQTHGEWTDISPIFYYCSEEFCQSILFNLVDLNAIKQFSLFYEENGGDRVLELVKGLDLKLKNLENFVTNFDYKIFIKFNFQFYKNCYINELQLIHEPLVPSPIYFKKIRNSLENEFKFFSLDGINMFWLVCRISTIAFK
jgi:hypothetical protein